MDKEFFIKVIIWKLLWKKRLFSRNFEVKESSSCYFLLAFDCKRSSSGFNSTYVNISVLSHFSTSTKTMNWGIFDDIQILTFADSFEKESVFLQDTLPWLYLIYFEHHCIRETENLCIYNMQVDKQTSFVMSFQPPSLPLFYLFFSFIVLLLYTCHSTAKQKYMVSSILVQIKEFHSEYF